MEVKGRTFPLADSAYANDKGVQYFSLALGIRSGNTEKLNYWSVTEGTRWAICICWNTFWYPTRAWLGRKTCKQHHRHHRHHSINRNFFNVAKI